MLCFVKPISRLQRVPSSWRPTFAHAAPKECPCQDTSFFPVLHLCLKVAHGTLSKPSPFTASLAPTKNCTCSALNVPGSLNLGCVYTCLYMCVLSKIMQLYDSSQFIIPFHFPMNPLKQAERNNKVSPNYKWAVEVLSWKFFKVRSVGVWRSSMIEHLGGQNSDPLIPAALL